MPLGWLRVCYSREGANESSLTKQGEAALQSPQESTPLWRGKENDTRRSPFTKHAQQKPNDKAEL